jgi:hypothetical protein
LAFNYKNLLAIAKGSVVCIYYFLTLRDITDILEKREERCMKHEIKMGR